MSRSAWWTGNCRSATCPARDQPGWRCIPYRQPRSGCKQQPFQQVLQRNQARQLSLVVNHKRQVKAGTHASCSTPGGSVSPAMCGSGAPSLRRACPMPARPRRAPRRPADRSRCTASTARSRRRPSGSPRNASTAEALRSPWTAASARRLFRTYAGGEPYTRPARVRLSADHRRSRAPCVRTLGLLTELVTRSGRSHCATTSRQALTSDTHAHAAERRFTTRRRGGG
jgi:hypothetical protein